MAFSCKDYIEGNLFSLENNEYTAPEDGIYFFESRVTIDTRNNSPEKFYLYYSVNGMPAAFQNQYSLPDGYISVRLNSTLKLKKSDTVTFTGETKGNSTTTMGNFTPGNVSWTGFKVE